MVSTSIDESDMRQDIAASGTRLESSSQTQLRTFNWAVSRSSERLKQNRPEADIHECRRNG
jgi:hypothetical protein